MLLRVGMVRPERPGAWPDRSGRLAFGNPGPQEQDGKDLHLLNFELMCSIFFLDAKLLLAESQKEVTNPLIRKTSIRSFLHLAGT